ncbi:MAG: SiaB family protein kinase [Bacteroidales bacterium]|nr:SiaB family protein kinase [Bacteroidales bacterium]
MIDTNIVSLMKSKTLLSYRGPFYIELISVFGMNIRNFNDIYINARKKLFKIFIELSQNVSNYSEDFHMVNNVQRIGIGELYLTELGESYSFTTKNQVKVTDANILAERCELVNASDQGKLRELKREQRINSPGEKFGARIGLIQAVMLSRNKLDYKVEEIDEDFSYFSLTVTIDKY